MDWDNLRIVLAVSRGGSLTAAALLLGVDQTTAGRRLSSLERHLDAALFVRSKAGFQPTEKGHEVISAALDIEARMEALNDAIAEPSTGARGLVRLIANPWMLERFAGDDMRRLLEANPHLEIRMSGRLPPVPVHGGVTVALWFDAEPSPPDIAVPIARITYGAYHSATASDDNSSWVIFRDDDARGPSFTRQLARRFKDAQNVRLTATDATTLRAAARAGIGRAVLPVCLGEDAGDLRRDESFQPIERILHLHLNRNMANTTRVRTLLDWLAPVLERQLNAKLLNKNALHHVLEGPRT